MIKIAIMAGSGVGKTSLIKELRDNKALTDLNIGDIDEYLPFDEMSGISPEEMPEYWDCFEMKAAEKAVNSGVNLIFGVMTSTDVQDYFRKKGYKLYALVVPKEVQLERIKKRETETGKRVNIKMSLAGNDLLLSSEYPKIDGNRPVREIARHIIFEIVNKPNDK